MVIASHEGATLACAKLVNVYTLLVKNPSHGMYITNHQKREVEAEKLWVYGPNLTKPRENLGNVDMVRE